ncbi:MAG: hypothetical protein E5Y73_17120 [Mesorhizobium sp.]|uniref:amidase family protein n=1 Tax=Mesorhizobium sp. TaxID=1871066 RepID=UPI001219FBB3|nr:amidase family protein [Mesorhizobium sp.]TIL91399.1 MAG: hypothetical protein E5Y73_17120 [Mesorhizobium sp.]
MTTDLHIVEASIAQLRQALEAGTVTSVELVGACLRRIAHYDRHGVILNAVPVLNPKMFEEAAASDWRRRKGAALGPLDGIPYTAKDSYKVSGLTVAAGSPAFEHLIANEDAFTIGRLRAGGAVLIGLTNMPPMANGGMQRGVYGRAESPYNADYLTAAFASGSSNGSGTATAASFAAFGLGEETWSSGRAPASNNALVAYTPSRGVISVRGNWPLVPTMDVVVPHTRSVPDMLELLDVIVADDPNTRGDFWRAQPWVALPADADVNEASAALAWRNGTWVANGNLVPRHLGIPTVTVPMGAMADIGMPVGLTFAGKAYDDTRLLRLAGDFERFGQRRSRPPRTPELPDDVFFARHNASMRGETPPLTVALAAETRHAGDQDEITVTLDVAGTGIETSVNVHVNGEPIRMQRTGARFTGRAVVPAKEHERIHSVWRGSYGSIVSAVVHLEDGRAAGAYMVTGGIG